MNGRVAIAALLVCACGGGAEERRPEPGTTLAPLPVWASRGPGGGAASRSISTSQRMEPPETPRAAAIGRRAGSGRRIDLDVKDADFGDVCRFLADAGRANVVIGDGVGGTVTVRLTQVPWDEALDAIARVKGYRVEREGNIYTVTKP